MERISQGVPDAADTAAPLRARGRGFARRLYVPRVIGLALGFLAVGAVLHESGAGAAAWAALAFNAFVWPHLAYLHARRSRDPVRAERRNLVADSAAGGVWIAAMGFNLLPSVALVAMLGMDKIAAGGVRLALRAGAAQALACAAAALLIRPELRLATSMLEIAGALPLLVVYPMVVGVTAHRLARRVRAQNRLLAELSRTDGLSGLLNRTSWEQVAFAEFGRARRHGGAVSLLMIDVDEFKTINDRHGHLVGDEVIRSVAALVRDTLRKSDVAGRYGGEEFGVLLPDADAAEAAAIAERMRQRIESATLDDAGEVRCTASIGVAEFTADLVDPRQLIERADRALYRAKALGRNRVVRHGATAADALHVVGSPSRPGGELPRRTSAAR